MSQQTIRKADDGFKQISGLSEACELHDDDDKQKKCQLRGGDAYK